MAMSSHPRKKRPCSICRKWFAPDPRIRGRQRTCGAVCSEALTKRRQGDWRKRNADYSSGESLRRKIAQAEAGESIRVPSAGSLTRIPWRAVQTQLGVKQAVVLAFTLRLLDRALQTMMAAKIGATSPYPGRHLTIGYETQIPVRGGGSDDHPDLPAWRT